MFIWQKREWLYIAVLPELLLGFCLSSTSHRSIYGNHADLSRQHPAAVRHLYSLFNNTQVASFSLISSTRFHFFSNLPSTPSFRQSLHFYSYIPFSPKIPLAMAPNLQVSVPKNKKHIQMITKRLINQEGSL